MTSVHQSSKRDQAILAIRAQAIDHIASIQSRAIQEIREIEQRAIQAIKSLEKQEKKAQSRKAYQARKAREAFLKRQARREQKARSAPVLPMRSLQTVEIEAVPRLTLSLCQPVSDNDDEPNWDEYMDYSPPCARSESSRNPKRNRKRSDSD
jgi:hypothetical protein